MSQQVPTLFVCSFIALARDMKFMCGRHVLSGESQLKVVLVETRDPKSRHEVTGLSGLGSFALPGQQQFMTFFG